MSESLPTPSSFFAGRLAELRSARGLSQYALAAAAGVHRSYVLRIERGLQLPRFDVLVRLARALDVCLCDFDPTPKKSVVAT